MGALAGYVLFKSYLNEKVFGILLAAVAGIMVYIALDELLPSAQNDENHHIATYSMISGMIVMAVSLMVI